MKNRFILGRSSLGNKPDRTEAQETVILDKKIPSRLSI
jgi:hypothetical protein